MPQAALLISMIGQPPDKRIGLCPYPQIINKPRFLVYRLLGDPTGAEAPLGRFKVRITKEREIEIPLLWPLFGNFLAGQKVIPRSDTFRLTKPENNIGKKDPENKFVS